MSSPPPILILFANLKGNLGDFAILEAMLKEISRQHPGADISVMSHGQHEVDAARFEAFVKRVDFDYRGRTPFYRVPMVFRVLKRLGMSKWVSGHLIKKLSRDFAERDSFEEIQQYGTVYFCGGEQWSGYSNGITMLAILRMLAGMNKDLRIFPFSVKKKLLEMHGDEDLKLCFGAFDGRLLTRDSRSLETMEQFSKGVQRGVDCVFSLAANFRNIEIKSHPIRSM